MPLASQAVLRVCVTAFVVVGAVERWRLVSELLRLFTNEDQAVLWLAASDWMRLNMQELSFYGQSYGATLEAIPMGLLHEAGVPFPWAFPVSMVGLGLVNWWLVSAAAWRGGMRTASLAAAAAPLLLNLDHWVVSGTIGTGAGRFLAACCMALCLAFKPTPRTVAAAVASGGLAVAMAAGSTLIVAPVMLWAASRWDSRRLWKAAACGSVMPLAWKGMTLALDVAFPDHILHPTWSAVPDAATLLKNIQQPDRLFAAHALDLFPHGWTFWAACALCVCVAWWSRQLWTLAAVACLPALLGLVAALPKSLDEGGDLWFPAARVTLSAPLALWFVGTVACRAALPRWKWWRPSQASVAAVLVLACMTCVLTRAWVWDSRLKTVAEKGLSTTPVPLHSASAVLLGCAHVAAIAEETGTTVVMFPFDRTATYACAALHPELVTVHPFYERRFHVLRQLAAQPAERMLLWSVTPQACATTRFQSVLTTCTPLEAGDAVLVEFPMQPPLDVLHALGFAIRPFGPGCHPDDPTTCPEWARRYGPDAP